MLAGGALLVLAGLALGEGARLDMAQVSARSWAALGYLVALGSLVGFSRYVWLLRVAPPAVVGSYAFVNPVVALGLGWALAGEPLTLRTLAAGAIIVGAVALLTMSRTRKAPAPARVPAPAAWAGESV